MKFYYYELDSSITVASPFLYHYGETRTYLCVYKIQQVLCFYDTVASTVVFRTGKENKQESPGYYSTSTTIKRLNHFEAYLKMKFLKINVITFVIITLSSTIVLSRRYRYSAFVIHVCRCQK